MNIPETQVTAVDKTLSDDDDGGAQRLQAPGSPKGGWTRTMTNFVLDAVLMLLFISLVGVTAIVRFVFPPAALSAGWSLWGWPLDQWLSVQFFLIATFMLAVLLHVMLHWNWICGVVANRYSKWKGRIVRIDDANKTVWGVAFLIMVVNILGIFLAIAALAIQRPEQLP